MMLEVAKRSLNQETAWFVCNWRFVEYPRSCFYQVDPAGWWSGAALFRSFALGFLLMRVYTPFVLLDFIVLRDEISTSTYSKLYE